MTFFSKMINALGFGNDDEEFVDETSASETVETQISTRHEGVRPPLAGGTPMQSDVSPEMVHKIFDKVVEIVNASLPDFLAQSVDPEREKQYMFEALEDSVKQYILSLEESAQARCMALWQSERDNLKSEMDELRRKARELEERRNEMKERQLSADRQKRALSERVHDLEAQVLKLEAEKEQFDLENKSLINKAKVAGVYETELEEMRQRLAAMASGEADQALASEIESLKKKIADSEARIEELTSENIKLKDACEAAKTRDQVEDSMLNDLRKHTAEANEQVKKLQEQLDKANAEIENRDARIADANRRIAEQEALNEQSQATHEQLLAISEQVERFGEVKDKLDTRIAQLKESLQTLQNENESLRDTIKNNLFEHARQEKELRDRLESLQSKHPEEKPAEEKPRVRRRAVRDDDTSDVEDVISNTDWLMTSPSSRLSDDFGYQPPAKKPRIPDNDAQMNLFDLNDTNE